MELEKFDLDELLEVQTLHSILICSRPHDEEFVFAYDKLKEKISDFDQSQIIEYTGKIYNRGSILLKELVTKKFPTVLIPGYVSVYHEYPDFSQSYTYDEIADTFSSLSELEYMYAKLLTKKYSNTTITYFLTEKSFRAYGNICPVFHPDDCECIYENPETNEYLYVVPYRGHMFLTDRKIID